MEDLIRTCYIIRKGFEKAPAEKSALDEILANSKELHRLLRLGNYTINVQNQYMTIGIAFAIQTLLIKTEAKSYSLKKYFVINAMRCLINGLHTYDNKRWKGECAYWAAIVFFENEIYLNDCLCDILVLQKKEVTLKNIEKLKSHLIESLIRYTVEVNFENKTYIPLYNENNGYNWQTFNEQHLSWSETGNKIEREEGCKGKEYTLKQEKDALQGLYDIINKKEYERFKITR